MKKKLAIISLLFILGMASYLTLEIRDSENDLQYGMAKFYWKKYDYQKSAAIFQTLANNGHKKSMVWVGKCYEYGFLTPMSEKTALEWYLKAKDQADAQLFIAGFYMWGKAGLFPDQKEYAKWIKLSAQNGYVVAQRNLAYNYENHHGEQPIDGIGKDDSVAAFWYSKAAKQGDNESKARLGQMYIEGRGVATSTENGLQLLSEAAHSIEQCGLYNYGSYLANRKRDKNDFRNGCYWLFLWSFNWGGEDSESLLKPLEETTLDDRLAIHSAHAIFMLTGIHVIEKI